MPLNKSTGNMFDWVTHTWNTVKGECPHGCHYCYMGRWGKQKPIRFVESELKTNLGKGNTIFVGSSCDLFADSIDKEWILKTFDHCRKFDNTYLFQTKNPSRLAYYRSYLPEKVILGTTIESNEWHEQMGNAPEPKNRAGWLSGLHTQGYKTTITIEPIMDFKLVPMVGMIDGCQPNWVSIGANTRYEIKLNEPNKAKVGLLIEYIKDVTDVKIKSNLKRLLYANNICSPTPTTKGG